MDAASPSTFSHADDQSVPLPRPGGLNSDEGRQAGFREDHEKDFSSSMFDMGKNCTICYYRREFPQATPTDKCQHGIEVCIGCLRDHISYNMARGGWRRVDCPTCRQRLEYSDVRASAAAEVFEEYDQRLFEACLDTMDHFQRCHKEGCRSGQISFPNKTYMVCVKCGEETCIKCGAAWHSGRSCEQVQASKTTPDVQASEEFIQERCKLCPVCKSPARRGGGCAHIVCPICKHEYCWDCLGDWEKIRLKGTDEWNTHQNGCPELLNNPAAALDYEEEWQDDTDYEVEFQALGYLYGLDPGDHPQEEPDDDHPSDEPEDYPPEPDNYSREDPDHDEAHPPTETGWNESSTSGREENVDVGWDNSHNDSKGDDYDWNKI